MLSRMRTWSVVCCEPFSRLDHDIKVDAGPGISLSVQESNIFYQGGLWAFRKRIILDVNALSSLDELEDATESDEEMTAVVNHKVFPEPIPKAFLSNVDIISWILGLFAIRQRHCFPITLPGMIDACFGMVSMGMGFYTITPGLVNLAYLSDVTKYLKDL
jgi:hypothetical protein